jgi:hypothetical protein
MGDATLKFEVPPAPIPPEVQMDPQKVEQEYNEAKNMPLPEDDEEL